MDYEALAKQFGGTVEAAPTRIEISGAPIFAESAGAGSVTPPEGFQLLSSSQADAKPKGSYYDKNLNAWLAPTGQAMQEAKPDMAALAAQYGGTIQAEPEPETTLTGLSGAATRGLALPAAGAALGAAMGAPFAGVGAIPGAIAGAGAATLAGLVADPVVGAVNSMLGTQYTMPTDALADILTRVGVANPKTEAERIVQAASAGAGGAGGMVAAGKTLASAASPIVSGVGEMLAASPGFQAVSGATGGGAGQISKEAGAGPVGQVAATLGGAMLPAVPQIARMATQAAAKAVAPKGAGIIEQQEPTMRESAQSIAASVKGKIEPGDQSRLVKKLEAEPDSIDVVKYRLSGTQAVPDNLASEALKQGWKDGAVASIKAATPKDRTAMTKMLNIFKLGEKSEKFRALNRPADILGDTVQARVDFLANSNKQAGQAIDNIAKTQLQGQRIDYDKAINSFVNDLGEIGVKVEMGSDGVAKAVLQGSDIQGDRQAQRVLNAVLERLSNVKAPDAYGLHTAKRFIDTQVNYGKKNLANPLTAQAERTLKNLRRNLNETLGDANPKYRAANDKYSETITALDDLQKSAGTQIDFDSPNANKALGTAMRKLTSNYGTRANLIDSLDQANQVASKYGMKLDDDIVNQLIFVNELDRMFGAAAQTSLKGQVSEAAQTGIDIARGRIAGRAFDLMMEKAENLRGVNRENAIKSMEEILKRKQP